MNGIRVGRLFGIDVAIHPSWFVVLAFFAFSLATGFFPSAYPGWSAVATWTTAVVATLLLFASVLAHEFGHSLVARSQGIPVRNITLFILGGVAQLEREPDSPGREAWMAIAGPLVSVAIGARGARRGLRAARTRAARRRCSPTWASPTWRWSPSTSSPASRSTAAGCCARCSGASRATSCARPARRRSSARSSPGASSPWGPPRSCSQAASAASGSSSSAG